MRAASRAAFAAPGGPIASVPTGTPFGICAIESNASIPPSAVAATGTPNTGNTVFAAIMPGRCAAPPAAAMITWSPRASAVSAYSNIQSGVRWAETIRLSCGMPSSASSASAGARVSASDELPMITPTRGSGSGCIAGWCPRGAVKSSGLARVEHVREVLDRVARGPVSEGYGPHLAQRR